MADDVLRLEHIYKSYPTAEGSLTILEDLSLSVSRGETVSIIGQSGSGKSTLLSVAALLLKKDSGRIFYQDIDTDKLKKDQVTKLRSDGIGFIFQGAMLLEDFSALENIAMPLMIKGMNKKQALMEAEKYLDMVSLSSRSSHRPVALSGGEKARVAIARALAPNPDMIFADEPTGSLDEKSADSVASLLFDVVRRENRSMVLVTHNTQLASRCDRRYLLRGGRLE